MPIRLSPMDLVDEDIEALQRYWIWIKEYIKPKSADGLVGRVVHSADEAQSLLNSGGIDGKVVKWGFQHNKESYQVYALKRNGEFAGYLAYGCNQSCKGIVIGMPSFDLSGTGDINHNCITCKMPMHSEEGVLDGHKYDVDND